MGPLVYLCIVLAAAIPATYGAMTLKMQYAVKAAVGIAEAKAVTSCNARVTEISRIHNEGVTRSADEARRAGDLVPDAPEADAELAKLCQASASCRSRNAMRTK